LPTATGKQTSLRTKDEGEAITLLNTKNEATWQPAMNLQIAQAYLQHADPTLAQRTWQDVMRRRRKQDIGQTIVKKTRQVYRLPIGLHQRAVYQ
jgi:hypothetical protein